MMRGHSCVEMHWLLVELLRLADGVRQGDAAGADTDYPGRYEPSGYDFLSPARTEAELMARLLPAGSSAPGWTGSCPASPAASRPPCSPRSSSPTPATGRSLTCTA